MPMGGMGHPQVGCDQGTSHGRGPILPSPRSVLSSVDSELPGTGSAVPTKRDSRLGADKCIRIPH